jgi:hypothetical protein
MAVTKEAMWGITLIPVFLASFILAIIAVIETPEDGSGSSRRLKPPWSNPTG